MQLDTAIRMMKHGEFSTLTTPMAADRRAAFPPPETKTRLSDEAQMLFSGVFFFFNLHIHILFWMLQSGQDKSKKKLCSQAFVAVLPYQGAFQRF